MDDDTELSLIPWLVVLLILTTCTARSKAVSPGSVVEREGRGLRGGDRERQAACEVGELGGLLCALLWLLLELIVVLMFKEEGGVGSSLKSD